MQGEPEKQTANDEAAMRKRRTTLADGQYMIYYTFDGSLASHDAAQEDVRLAEPAPHPESSEEQRV